MSNHPPINRSYTAPRGIVALIFALGVLAERASGLPGPVRRLVLYFLRRGELVAHSYVYWALRDGGAPLFWAAPASARHGSSRDAALDLAMWFRTLALALRDLPRRALIIHQAKAAWRFAALRDLLPALLAASCPQAPDTS